jgi:5'-nucleotidase
MNRRSFVQIAGLSTLATLSGNLNVHGQSFKKGKKITILHTNDTHSNIDPFPMNHAKYPGMGGVAKRAALIDKIRREEEHVVLLDAGDIFQGTPYFNRYHGVLEMQLMSKMGYDAATMGNHDFDIALTGFKNAQAYAEFPFICSNYDFKESIMADRTLPNVILKRGALKIGILGVGIDLNGLVHGSNFEGMRYLDPIATANAEAKKLVDKGCDLIICLSHLGFEYGNAQISDKVLAANTKNIHLILGGHTHTFLEKPFVAENLQKQPVLINQTGWAGLFLGRIDIDFEKGRFKQSTLSVI